jgi:hypothetical protein
LELLDFLSSEQYQGVDKVFQAIKGLFDSKQVFGETHQNILDQLHSFMGYFRKQVSIIGRCTAQVTVDDFVPC